MPPHPPPHDQLPLADELSTVFARMSGLLLTEETVESALAVVAALALDTVPDSVGAGVTVIDHRGRRVSSGSTDARVEQADALQYESTRAPASPRPGGGSWSGSTTPPPRPGGRGGPPPSWRWACGRQPARRWSPGTSRSAPSRSTATGRPPSARRASSG